MPQDKNLPPFLKYANRVIVFLNNIGITTGPPHVLTVVGRVSGEPRSTPVSIVVVDGARYVVAGQKMSWVKNVRAAGRGEIQRGRRREAVNFTEMTLEQRGPILSAYWHQHSQGRKVAAQIFEVGPEASAADFAAAAPRCAVFRLDDQDSTTLA
ncbi:deazaflavin-dependent nitroreductase [Rathayibacter sp. AY1E8]|uniref:nitroreductase family deazaflavin-dependent oxidoreductase n=1 Tax=unclassified Rathayibacter TaxID=2609250 RepID=UPI000CE7358B|nr:MULTISPECIES: nitroreductase family deazaflavin-dependent oxidoreductase [unclassified Rathayibacter]PPF41694.1 deazaflavin-dependent nitroreductase [Rathayibacter sp. AY1A1]PPG18797.1 deazaflavin-dependent nitroreductase [Rathayibacter sp. AY1E8]PPH01130.1 deazaflavin-dependent nitroreductase [Rathayibacter sp. AY1G9]PPH05749.1 deazaflavin-dependent nitroreductase [Rathayibacter sp. AY1F6]